MTLSVGIVPPFFYPSRSVLVDFAYLEYFTDPSVTDYILEEPVRCPRCGREVFEKTLVEPTGD
jgi:hypothetical protein